MKVFKATPRASVLIESLRDIGYSLDTALADIVDNAITAGSSNIRIIVDTDDARIGILDNGSGMTEPELLDAMRPGSKSPLTERPAADLGRFGLGLKTASFSQCRRLTVITRHSGRTSAAIWDLDHVAACDEWEVQIPDNAKGFPWAELLETDGTLVIWEKIDRPFTAGSSRDSFVRAVDHAREHLELVFHRFLAGEQGLKRIDISMNGRPLRPFDPFHSKHSATTHGPVETIKIRDAIVQIQPFTLPHHRNVSTAEWERYGRRAGYVRNQGFYVYREKRLIIYGTWFGLARQSELTKLARVRVDMPATLDSEWTIDVKKASAKPPVHIQERFRRIIDSIGANSKRAFTARGARLTEASRIPVWRRLQSDNAITYEINTDHPIVTDLMERLPESLQSDFLNVIEVAAAALPIDALFADIGSMPNQVTGKDTSDETLLHAVSAVYRQLRTLGMSADDIRATLQTAEPFVSHRAACDEIMDQLIEEEECQKD